MKLPDEFVKRVIRRVKFFHPWNDEEMQYLVFTLPTIADAFAEALSEGEIDLRMKEKEPVQ